MCSMVVYLCVCVFVYVRARVHACMHYPMKMRRGLRALGTRVADSCELWAVVAGSQMQLLLTEQHVLSYAKTSLVPPCPI